MAFKQSTKSMEPKGSYYVFDLSDGQKIGLVLRKNLMESSKRKIVTMFDLSGSMNGEYVEYLKAATRVFVAMEKGDEPVENFPFALTADRYTCKAHSLDTTKVGNVNPSGTNMLTAMKGFIEFMKTNRKDGEGEVQYDLVWLTDGGVCDAGEVAQLIKNEGAKNKFPFRVILFRHGEEGVISMILNAATFLSTNGAISVQNIDRSMIHDAAYIRKSIEKPLLEFLSQGTNPNLHGKGIMMYPGAKTMDATTSSAFFVEPLVSPCDAYYEVCDDGTQAVLEFEEGGVSLAELLEGIKEIVDRFIFQSLPIGTHKGPLIEFLKSAAKAFPETLDPLAEKFAEKIGLVRENSFGTSLHELIELVEMASVQFRKKRSEQELAKVMNEVKRPRYAKSAGKCVKTMGGLESAMVVAKVCKLAVEYNEQRGGSLEGPVSGITLSRFAEDVSKERVHETIDILIQMAVDGMYGSQMNALAKIVDEVCNFLGQAVTFTIPDGLDPLVMALNPFVDFTRMHLEAMNFVCSPSDCSRKLRPFNAKTICGVVFLDPAVFDILMKGKALELFGNYAARRTFGAFVTDTTMALYVVLYANLSSKLVDATLFEWEKPLLVQLLPCVEKLVTKWFKGCALQPNGLYLPTEKRKVEAGGKAPPNSTAVLEFTPGICEGNLAAYLEGGVSYMQCLMTLPKLDAPLPVVLRIVLVLLVTKPWREHSFFKRFTVEEVLGVRTAQELEALPEFSSQPSKRLAPGDEKEVSKLWYGPVAAVLALRQGAIPSPDFVEDPEYSFAAQGVSALDAILAVISEADENGKIAGFAQREKDRIEFELYSTHLYEKSVKETTRSFVAKIVPMERAELEQFLLDFKPRKASMKEFLAESDPEKRMWMIPMHVKHVLRYIQLGGRFPGVLLFEAKGLSGVIQEFNSIDAPGGVTLFTFLSDKFKNNPLLLEKLKEANFCVATKRETREDGGIYTVSNPQPIPAPKIVAAEEEAKLEKFIRPENAKLYSQTCSVLLELEGRIASLDPALKQKVRAIFSKQFFDYPFFTKGYAAKLVKEAEEADCMLMKLKTKTSDQAAVFAAEISSDRFHNLNSLRKVIERCEARAKFHGLSL